MARQLFSNLVDTEIRTTFGEFTISVFSGTGVILTNGVGG